MTMTESRTQTIVPALPGWYVALFMEAVTLPSGESRDACFSLEPIIAWEIERHVFPYHPVAGRPAGEHGVSHDVNPITVNGNMLTGTANEWAIKRPDGTFEIPGDCSCVDETSMIAEFKSRAMAAKKK
jgi:hypothetical protein